MPLFLVRLSVPHILVSDETLYVPAARAGPVLKRGAASPRDASPRACPGVQSHAARPLRFWTPGQARHDDRKRWQCPAS